MNKNREDGFYRVKKCNLFMIVMLAVVIFFPLYSFAARGKNYGVNNERGVLDLSSKDLNIAGPVSLDTLWDFRWNRLLKPGDFEWNEAVGIHGYYPVPLFWTGYEDLNLPSKGYATYRLIIKVPVESATYGLRTPEIFTEYRLWINGKLMDQHGTLAGEKIRFLNPGVFIFNINSGEIEIILQVKNISHGNAGIGQSFILGKEYQIIRSYILSISMEIILIAICIFAGFYHTIIFIFRKEEKELLYFGLFCIIISVRTLSTGNTLLTQMFPDLAFNIGSRIATAVIPLSVITFQSFVYYFFKDIFNRWVFLILTVIHGFYLVLLFAASTFFYSTVFTYYLGEIAVSAFYIIGIGFYAIIKRKQYSVIFMSGFIFILIGAANDMLHYMQVINTGYYLALFFSAFIIIESVMLAIRFSMEHRAVSELSEKLKVMDRLKDEFLANTSHELRTPLNGIIGVAESLIDGVTGPLPYKTKQNLKLIVSSGRRLFNLINDILDFSKLRHNDIDIQRQEIDLKQLVSVVMTVIKATMPGKDVELINDISEDTPQVIGDENRLQQIMFNLIGNGVKFTSSGYVKVSCLVKGSYVEVRVEDSGIGIAKGRLDAIFRSFEQADGSISREYSGTGLGLSITKKLVQLHGGEIHVESEPGKGSCFIFTLQGVIMRGLNSSGKELSSANPVFFKGEVKTPEIIQETVNDGVKGNILIVDDELINVQVLINHLFIRNIKAEYALSGVEAIKKIENGSYDLVLLDLMMPRMSGYDVCRKLREKYSNYELPVIILTAKNRSADIVAAFEAGANDYIVKPIDRIELYARIDTQLSLKRAVNEAMVNADLANTDHLTGMHNRRFFMNAGEREFLSAKRYGAGLSLIMLDIDYFKRINDTHGHDAGDIIIQRLASIINENIRGLDISVRFGGDEFLIILPGTASSGAMIVAEKIRKLSEESVVNTGRLFGLKFTISLGVSSLKDGTCSIEELIKEADDMLYISKKDGRNRVTIDTI